EQREILQAPFQGLARDLVGDLALDPHAAFQLNIDRYRRQAGTVGHVLVDGDVWLVAVRGGHDRIALALGHADKPVTALGVRGGPNKVEPFADARADGPRVAPD